MRLHIHWFLSLPVFPLEPTFIIQQSARTCLIACVYERHGIRMTSEYLHQPSWAWWRSCVYTFPPFCNHAEWFASSSYYRVFMYHYSLSLQIASFLMVNSTWTKNHVDAILRHHDSLLDFLYLTTPLLASRFLFLPNNAPSQSRMVYPPCDTREMVKFSLMPRERVILSVAQFRFVNQHQ
jgi:hypothetical protein